MIQKGRAAAGTLAMRQKAKRLEQEATAAELRFNRKLWRRFRALAQPYFYPAEEGGADWALLLVALLLAVVAGTYWLAAAGMALALALLPARFVPKELPGRAQKLGTAPWPLTALAALVAAGLVVYRRRAHLRGRWLRWAMLGLLLFLLFCVTGLNVYISYVFRGIDNKLVEREEAGFYQAMFGYGLALVVAVPVIGFYKYIRMALARRWRAFLFEFFLERYLANRAFYRLDSNSEDTDIDNPDQRITEDVDYFSSETLSFLLDVLGGILDLFSFAAILWSTSKALMRSLLAYAAVGTLAAIIAGQRLVEINYLQLRREADLRYSLIHVRDNAEAIAFYGGEALEGAAVRERLNTVMANYDRLINWTVLTTIYQRMFFYLARLVPYLVIGGLYFAKEVDFGTVGQGAFAFSMVLSSVTLIIERIQSISRFSAGINRLGAFYDELKDTLPAKGTQGVAVGKTDEELEPLVDESASRSNGDEIRSASVPGADVRLSCVTLQTPTGRTLVENLNWNEEGVGCGDGGASARRLLIVGPSGFGKSSVLRAVAGLWTRGSGKISRPPAGEMLFLPQKPYMPLGDLRMQLLYPNVLADCTDEELLSSLASLGLKDLPARFPGGFDAVQDWARVLSGGEQQRLAAARCLVAKPAPALVVLDEATSALPAQDEANLYKLLQARGISYISVGHRESLLKYHNVVLEICGGGLWRTLAPAEYRPLAYDGSPGTSLDGQWDDVGEPLRGRAEPAEGIAHRRRAR